MRLFVCALIAYKMETKKCPSMNVSVSRIRYNTMLKPTEDHETIFEMIVNVSNFQSKHHLSQSQWSNFVTDKLSLLVRLELFCSVCTVVLVVIATSRLNYCTFCRL